MFEHFLVWSGWLQTNLARDHLYRLELELQWRVINFFISTAKTRHNYYTSLALDKVGENLYILANYWEGELIFRTMTKVKFL